MPARADTCRRAAEDKEWVEIRGESMFWGRDELRRARGSNIRYHLRWREEHGGKSTPALVLFIDDWKLHFSGGRRTLFGLRSLLLILAFEALFHDFGNSIIEIKVAIRRQ